MQALLVTPEARNPFIEIPLLPAPDRRLRYTGAPHDLESSMTVRRRQHDLGPPGQFARRVAVGDQRLKFSAVGGAKVKADVSVSHTQRMTHPSGVGNLMSGGEH